MANDARDSNSSHLLDNGKQSEWLEKQQSRSRRSRIMVGSFLRLSSLPSQRGVGRLLGRCLGALPSYSPLQCLALSNRRLHIQFPQVISALLILLAIIAIGVGVGVSVSNKNRSKTNGNNSNSTNGNSSNPVSQTDPNDPSTFKKDSRLKKSFYGIAYEPNGAIPPACGATLQDVITDIQLMSQLTKVNIFFPTLRSCGASSA